ncbi:MAG TPA: preprotein translocase subunit TatB [Natronosporangium sp.]|nr:preprotein translocase subunit TatB [Natronosporangium sp.]
MFSNLSWYEIVLLLLLALLIFGDRLPHVIADGVRMLRNLHRMARTATSDLSRELGTDLTLEDLNPKTFVRRHLLSEAEQEALTRPFRAVSDDLRRQAEDLRRHTEDLRAGVRRTGQVTGADGSPPAPRPAPAGADSYDDIT